MFYELKYDVTPYNVPVAMMLTSRCYRLQSTMFWYTMLPYSPIVFVNILNVFVNILNVFVNILNVFVNILNVFVNTLNVFPND